jgi:hypothetical protein
VLGIWCRSVVFFFNGLSVDPVVRSYSMVQLCLRWMLGSFVVISRCYFILGILMYGVLCSGGCGIDYDINGGGFRTRMLCFYIPRGGQLVSCISLMWCYIRLIRWVVVRFWFLLYRGSVEVAL